jgi:hypothetical protein
MKKIQILFTLLTLLSVSNAANSTLVYDANASSSFKLISADGMAITAESGLEGPFTITQIHKVIQRLSPAILCYYKILMFQVPLVRHSELVAQHH